ncbi:hypothetical protein ACL9Z5_002493 [Acinetobacter calcoaceticus]
MNMTQELIESSDNHQIIDEEINNLIKEINKINIGLYDNFNDPDQLFPDIRKIISNKLDQRTINLKYLTVLGKSSIKQEISNIYHYLTEIQDYFTQYENPYEKYNEIKSAIDSINSITDMEGVTPLGNYPYRNDLKLSTIDFERIFKEAGGLSLRPTEEYVSLYKGANEYEQLKISKKLIKLRNEVVKYPAQTRDNHLIMDLRDDLQQLFSSIGFEQKMNALEESVQTVKNIKDAQSLENLRKIESGYADEADSLNKLIKRLLQAIMLIFFITITIILYKLFLYYSSKIEVFKDSTEIILSITFVLTLTGLTTFLIKERNRLIKLHNHYKICDLELKSITSYMNELSTEQRQETLMKLSENYFKGGYETTEPEVNSTDVSENLIKTISDLTKVINDLKGAAK